MVKKLLILLFAFSLTLIVVAQSAHAEEALLVQGMQGNSVANLQMDLKALGYYSYNADGYFGALTRQSVINFQSSNGLRADGMVGPQTRREIRIDRVLQVAKQYQGVPYAWGGTTPSGFDCSGFTQYVFSKNGISLSRTSTAQFSQGTSVLRSQLRPGDLVFFSTYKPGPSHVGIYMGNNQFIQASSSQGITITDMNNSYFSQRYIGAKRIIW